MPAATCSGCNRTTNSATSNYWETEGKPTKCKVAMDPKSQLWVKGCDYGTSPMDEKMYGHLIGKSALPKPVPPNSDDVDED